MTTNLTSHVTYLFFFFNFIYLFIYLLFFFWGGGGGKNVEKKKWEKSYMSTCFSSYFAIKSPHLFASRYSYWFKTACRSNHYANMPMQYVEIFKGCKNDNF